MNWKVKNNQNMRKIWELSLTSVLRYHDERCLPLKANPTLGQNRSRGVQIHDMCMNASRHRLSTNQMWAECLSLKLQNLLAAAAAVVVVLPAFISLPPVTLRITRAGRKLVFSLWKDSFAFVPFNPLDWSFIPRTCIAGSPGSPPASCKDVFQNITLTSPPCSFFFFFFLNVIDRFDRSD